MADIIPTVVPSSIEDVERAAAWAAPFANVLHIDITDGVFAPNTTWMPQGEKLSAREHFVYEFHLMVAAPREVGLAARAAGGARIIGHVEATGEDTLAIFSAWKGAGAAQVGLGVLFQTPIEALDPYIKECDVVQMMSIARIGVQGIPYEPSAPERIAALHARHPSLLIADDGGVSEKNIADLSRAGVRRFCVGSALAKAPDPASTYERLASLAAEVE